MPGDNLYDNQGVTFAQRDLNATRLAEFKARRLAEVDAEMAKLDVLELKLVTGELTAPAALADAYALGMIEGAR